MGDNRYNSIDSRYIGAINNDDIEGKVILDIIQKKVILDFLKENKRINMNNIIDKEILKDSIDLIHIEELSINKLKMLKYLWWSFSLS